VAKEKITRGIYSKLERGRRFLFYLREKPEEGKKGPIFVKKASPFSSPEVREGMVFSLRKTVGGEERILLLEPWEKRFLLKKKGEGEVVRRAVGRTP